MLGDVASELEPVYLLTGSDRPKIALALRRLRGHFDDNAVELRPAPESAAEDVVAACNAMGLFAGVDGNRLVIVEDVDGRPNNEGKLVSGWKAADLATIVDYVGSPAPTTVLALVARELKADSPLGKACAKNGDVLSFDVAKKKLPEWVAEQFKRRGTRADLDACRALVELVGDSLDELASEVEKLTTWAAGQPVDVAAVELLSAGRAETSIFTLTDAWGRRDVAAVLAAAESRLERSDRPRSVEVTRLAGSLGSHVARVRACQALAAEGIRPREAAPRLKMHPFVAEKAFAQAQNFTSDELGSVVVRLAELDRALKGGSRLAQDLELERALVDVTRP